LRNCYLFWSGNYDQDLSNRQSRPVQSKGLLMILKLLNEWEALPYDGLRGKPPDWAPEFVFVTFLTHRLKIGAEILDGRLTLSEALSYLEIYIRKEELWRYEDNLLEEHRHEEVLELKAHWDNLKLPNVGNLDNSFDWLAELHEDLRLGEDCCLYRWLGHKLARNNLVGGAQRERSAAGGIKSGITRRDYAEHSAVIKCAKALRQADEPRRGLASRIKTEGEFSISIRQINHILKKANIK
jgi:hypothetical protein